MTHPPETIELLARALSDESGGMPWELTKDAIRDQYRHHATALLDQIAPHYREQAARLADGFAQQPETFSDIHDAGWNNAAICIAAAIRKGE